MGIISKILWIFVIFSVIFIAFMYVVVVPPAPDQCCISVNPSIIDVSQGGTTQTSVYVDFGFLYNSDVSLRAEPKSPYIHVYFKPEIIRHGSDSISTMVISADEEADTGEYEIPITLSSASYDKDWYDIKLIVLPNKMSTLTGVEKPIITETPTETPIVAETSASTTDTKASIRTPDINQISTIIGILASLATIFGSYIGYKQYKKHKGNGRN